MPKIVTLSIDEATGVTTVISTSTTAAATPAAITVGSKWVRTGGIKAGLVGNNYTVTGTADSGKVVVYAFKGKKATVPALFTIPTDKFLRECTKTAA